MVNKKMYRRIQELKNQGYGKSFVTKKLKIDPATVRKYFHMESEEFRAYLEQTSERIKIFAHYEHEILDLYSANNNQRLNMAAVYDFLEEKFKKLPGSEKSLRNYIHYLEKSGKLKYNVHIRSYQKVPELPYGKQLQVDFGMYTFRNGFRIYIFAAVLSASRFKYIVFQDRPFTTLDIILHLLDCFDYIGGIVYELVIDQDSLLVVDENYGDILYTKQFDYFLEEMDLKMYVCRKADPETKGKIENVIKYVKYNFLQVRSFETIEEANDAVRRWLVRRANGKISQASKKVPSIAIREERKHLRPLKNSIYRREMFVDREQRTASDKSFIMVDSNEYSVPMEYRKQIVEIYVTETELFIFDGTGKTEIARHRLSLETGQRIRNRDHFRHKSLPLEELQEEVGRMYPSALWKIFVEKIHDVFPRYFRDQCSLAKRLFSDETDDALLEEAVDYCLKNKTYTIKALHDTYQYFYEEQKQSAKIIQMKLGPITHCRDTVDEPLVHNRAVADYEKLVEAGKEGTR